MLCTDISDGLGACVPRFGSPMSVGPGGLGEHENERCSDTGLLRTVVDFRCWNSEVCGRRSLAIEGQHAGVRAGDSFAERGNVVVRGDKPTVGPAIAFGKIRQADAELEKLSAFAKDQSTRCEPGLGQYGPKPVSGIRVIYLFGGRA